MKLAFVLPVMLIMTLNTVGLAGMVDAGAQVPDHPRLLMTMADEQLIREQVRSNPVRKGVQAAIVGKCDSLITLVFS